MFSFSFPLPTSHLPDQSNLVVEDHYKSPSWTPSKQPSAPQRSPSALSNSSRGPGKASPVQGPSMDPAGPDKDQQSKPSTDNLHRPSLDQLKQSSFSTSTDSSVQNEKEVDQLKQRRESFARAGLHSFGPRKQSPLHVYSREFADAPVSTCKLKLSRTFSYQSSYLSS